MDDYNKDWLKSRGFFERERREILDNKEIFIDMDKNIAYLEVKNNDELESLRRLIVKKYPKILYICFYFPEEKKIKVFRRHGIELMWFWFKPKMNEESLKSRRDKLNKLSPNNIDVLFDTRDIADKFYWQLWEIRIRLAKNIKDLKEDYNRLMVVQHFIDRLIFFYFISQMGLIRIKYENKEIKLSRKQTREFINWLKNNLSDIELYEFLSELFFEVLGKVNESGWSHKKVKIGNYEFEIVAPSLNGGLFVENEIENKKEREIKIRGIGELIDILNKYNWIIGEEIPEEEDVIGELTPEIIGHIYEKFVVSLEKIDIKKLKLDEFQQMKEELSYGRKRIGAYYTPEEITSYISRNTIYPYLMDRMKEKFGERGRKLIGDKDSNIFKRDDFDKDEIEMIKYLYFDVLSKIKICDNACGSGSFLIAAGKILLKLYSRLTKILERHAQNDERVLTLINEIKNSPNRNYYIVRQIITNNLYGVDIMDGAVEIAKLRFWLWLVSQVDPNEIENKKIETLPNLDFNLVTGNSLIGFVDIEEVDMPIEIERKDRKTRWASLKEKYYPLTEFGPKGKISKISWLKELAEKKKKFKTLPSQEAMKIKESIRKDIEKGKEILNRKFYEIIKSKGIDISWEEFLDLKPFHWGFEFYEVFDLEKPKEERGFDIIIGNPPYINIYNIHEGERRIYPILYEFAYKKYDIYIIFIERSIKLSNKFGKFSYITSDKWIVEEYGYKFREFIVNTRSIREIVDLRDSQVFLGVGVKNVIFFLDKNKKFDNILVLNYNFKPKNLLSYLVIEQHPRYNLRLDISQTDMLIISTILKGSHKVGDFFYVNWGCRPSPSEKYVFSSLEECLKITKNKDLCKKLIKGADIGRYYFRWNGKWLAYLKSMYNPLSPELFENDRIILKDIGVDPIKATFIPGREKIYSDHTTINILNKNFTSSNESSTAKEKNLNLDLKALLVIINSRLINYYLKLFLSDQLHILPGNTKNIPIKFPRDEQILVNLCNYMLFLNEKDKRRKEEKELIEFIDSYIIDSLVYEIYFPDHLKTNLLELVEPYLEDIEKLKSDDEKLKTIRKVVEKIKNDEKVMKEIEKIKNHKWVKIIEGRN